MRGMTAFAGHFRREPYLSKGGRVPARSRAPAKIEKGSDGGARQGALRQALHGRLVRPAAAVRFGNLDSKKPATGFPVRAQFSIFAMMKICR